MRHVARGWVIRVSSQRDWQSMGGAASDAPAGTVERLDASVRAMAEVVCDPAGRAVWDITQDDILRCSVAESCD